MLWRHVFGKISSEFREISRVFVNFAGFRGFTIRGSAQSLATHRSFSRKSAGFPCEICLPIQEAQQLFKHHCCHFKEYSAARPCFCDMIPSNRWLVPKSLLTSTLRYG